MNASCRPSTTELSQFAALITDGVALSATAPTAKLANIEPPEIELATEEFVRKLDYHGITLLALEKGRLPNPVVDLIRHRKAMMVANDALKKRALRELFDAFNEAGLTKCILFKGSALAYSVYQSPWLRPRTDSDCLIDQADYSRFEDVFKSLGYQKLFAIEGKHISYQNTFSKALTAKSAINIDLHWRINNRQILAKSYTVDELLNDGDRLPAVSDSIRIPSKPDSLLIASLHRLGHHSGDERLTWLHDIHLLAEALNEQEWSLLVRKAEQKQLAAICHDALQLCQTLFDTQTPTQVSNSLLALSARAEPSQLFLQRDLSEWHLFWQDIKALDNLGEKLRLIFENVVPSPSYVRQQMGTQSTALAYVKRFARGVRRVM